MPIRFDIVVLNKSEEPVLVVEVKARLDTSRTWATELRRNLLEYGHAAGTPYFMFVGLDRMFLWGECKAEDLDAGPDYEIETQQALEEFGHLENITLHGASGSLLEMLATFWITQLIHAEPEVITPRNNWIVDSGLLDAIHDGKILKEALAGNGALS